MNHWRKDAGDVIVFLQARSYKTLMGLGHLDLLIQRQLHGILGEF